MEQWKRVLNFGSLNIDYVYRVPHFVRPGETLSGASFSVFAGGKGANQSVALSRAGGAVYHAGKVGPEGGWLVRKLRKAGVRTTHVLQGDTPTGHAIIQVDGAGQNAIVLFGGANKAITRGEADAVLSAFGEGTLVLLQNEINGIAHIMKKARQRGLGVCFNPAPFGREVPVYPLGLADILVLNETEGRGLSGRGSPERIVSALLKKFPGTAVVLTLGGRGVIYADRHGRFSLPAVKVRAVDTTAAGDCFIGYFLASLTRGKNVRESLQLAIRAAGLSVTRPGAMDSIPVLREVERFNRGP